MELAQRSLWQSDGMSVGAVFGALDGLLVLVDGQLSLPPSDTSAIPDVLDNDRRKFALAPRMPAVVLLTGQATMAGKDAWLWIQDRLDEATDDPPPPATPRDVARLACRVLDVVVALDNTHRREQGKALNVGVEGFVAGFALYQGTSDSRARPEVWTFGVHEMSYTDPQSESGFGDVHGDPLVVVPQRPAYRDPDDESRRLPADAIVEHFTPWFDRIRGQSVTHVRELVETEVPKIISSETDVLDRYGVGGTWRVIELRAGSPPRVTTRPWGPLRPPTGAARHSQRPR